MTLKRMMFWCVTLTAGNMYANYTATNGYTWTYSVTDGKATITAISPEPKGEVNVPAEFSGSPVIAMEQGVFWSKSGLTKISIPEGITLIGQQFSHCTSLEYANIPTDMTSIPASLFYDCGSLNDVQLPPNITSIGTTAFYKCYTIKSVILPNSLDTIIHHAFANCTGLTNLVMSSAITSIEKESFKGCTSLEKVVFPDTVGTMTIGINAFDAMTMVDIEQRNKNEIGYVFKGWTNSTGAVVSDPFHSPTTVTVSPWWQLPKAPIISPLEDFCFANVSQSVAISCDVEDATILYTTDGSNPAEYGREYNGEFIIYESCMIRAIVRKEGRVDSEEAAVKLTRAEPLSEAINLYSCLMETDTSNPWTVVTDVSHDGISCVRSGTIGNGGTTWMQTSVKKAGTVSFWWRSACEETEEEDGETYWYDYGVFLVDGVEKAKIAGNDTGWRKVEVEVPSGGKHILRWEYRKDGATSYSPDCIWLDQVQWISADDSGYTLTTPEPVPYSWLRDYNLGLDSDFEMAAKSLNGKNTGGKAMSVWQDYVAGTDPTNVNSIFTATIEMVDGLPRVTWSPNLNTNGEVRVYTVVGKTNLTDAAWVCPTNAAHRFFKVKVEMP